MAKKTTKSAANKPTPKGKKATQTKATKKKTPTKKQAKPTEIKLDPVEAKAFELAHSSEKVCVELEKSVISAASLAVRKVFKQHHISLTTSQAEKVALLLFGD
jgi:hypothetical protein